MSYFLVICSVLGAYSLLNLLGGERERRLMGLEVKRRAERAAAETHAKLHGHPMVQGTEPGKH